MKRGDYHGWSMWDWRQYKIPKAATVFRAAAIQRAGSAGGAPCRSGLRRVALRCCRHSPGWNSPRNCIASNPALFYALVRAVSSVRSLRALGWPPVGAGFVRTNNGGITTVGFPGKRSKNVFRLLSSFPPRDVPDSPAVVVAPNTYRPRVEAIRVRAAH